MRARVRLTPHFTREELECKCGCGLMLFTQAAVERLEDIRVDLGVPLVVTSGYRCPKHDADAHRLRHPYFTDAERHGPHTVVEYDNITVDALAHGQNAYELLFSSIAHGFTGIGISQKGDHGKRFIHSDGLKHTDARPRPTVWTY